MEIAFPSQLCMRRDCQSLSRRMTRDRHFPLSRSEGIPGRGRPEDRKKKQDEGQFPQQGERLAGWNRGSPRPSDWWCSVLENQRVETFPCHIFYCLLHLGQGFSFRPVSAVLPLLPELLRLGGRQLSFNWRSQVQALVLANIHPAAKSLRMTLNPLLLTLHIDLPAKRGKNKENWGS